MDCKTIGFRIYIGYVFDAIAIKVSAPDMLPSVEPCYRILLMREGTLHIRVNGIERILVGANVICLNDQDVLEILNNYQSPLFVLYLLPTVINPRLTYQAIKNNDIRPEDRPDMFYFIPFIHDADKSPRIFALSTSDAAEIDRHLSSIKVLLDTQEDAKWPCRSRAFILSILFALSRTDESKEPFIQNDIQSSTFTALAADVIHYLQTNIDRKITVEQITAYFHTNRTTLLSEFRKSTGQSINRYLTQLRMTMAAALLRDTTLCMTEICERTGFSDISYFSKAFKKEIRYSPSEYRRLSAS